MCSENNPNQKGCRKRQSFSSDRVSRQKRIKLMEKVDHFDSLPDDLVLCILSKLSSAAGSPIDLVNVLLTCKRMRSLVMNPTVLAKVSKEGLAVKAKNWSEDSHQFLKLCSDSGNIEASYTLGMIRFYCLENRASGASLMAKAAIASHSPSLYSLAVIQFNGSGGSKIDKDLRAGAALCARASFLGHVDALRELGHCLQDGYGMRQNVVEGRKFLVQANARELATTLKLKSSNAESNISAVCGGAPSCTLLSDFGCDIPPPEVHPANHFLVEWFAAMNGGDLGNGRRMFSHKGCGRPETRNHEFRRCSVCGTASYCSRACQAIDWKLGHKSVCVPPERWDDGGAAMDDGIDQS